MFPNQGIQETAAKLKGVSPHERFYGIATTLTDIHEINMDNCMDMEEVDEILEHSDLQEDHKQAILGENARRLYKA